MGFWRTLDDVAGGKTISQSRDAQAARVAGQHAAIQQREQLQDLQRKIGKSDPTAAMMLALDPEGMLKTLQKGYEPATLSGGQTRMGGPGVRPVTAPVLGMDGGHTFTQTPQGTAFTGQRPQSHVEKETAGHNRAQEAHQAADLDFRVQQAADALGMRKEELAALIKYREGQQAIGWFNAKKPPSSAVNISVGGGVSPSNVKWD